MRKALAIFAGERRDFNGCDIYRTTMPLHHLQAKFPRQWQTSWIFQSDLRDLMRKNGIQFLNNLLYSNDIIQFPRYLLEGETSEQLLDALIEGLRRLNKRAVYEVDDDFTNQHRNVTGQADALGFAKRCDAITVTTPYLANLMEAETGKRVYILPNCIDPEVWYEEFSGTFRYSDKVVIGLTGSKSHKDDWLVFKDVLPKLVEDNRVHLVIMGYHPDYLNDLPNASYVPGLVYNKYAQVIHTCDLIIAAVNDDPFNSSKSPIKVIEGMSARRTVNGQKAGAACIASNHLIYQLAIQHEKNGLLVEHTPEGWLTGLKRLIDDVPLRHQLQVAGHQWVMAHHDITKKIDLWNNAYTSIINSSPEKLRKAS